MPDEPEIPFGFKRVFGQLQKGDGVWNGTRFRKVRKQYPSTTQPELFAIRKCEMVQTELINERVDTSDDALCLDE